MVQAAGFLLAGGQSTRMGRNKALLKLGGVTLAEIGLAKLRQVCAEVAIAGGSDELSRFARVIPDGEPGQGPLAGLVAALHQSSHDWNLFLPVDVPMLPVEALERLLAAADLAPGSVAVLAELRGQGQVQGHVQPLCGLYSRRALETLRAELAAGRLKVVRAIEAAGPVAKVAFAEADWFRNANTPEEFAQLTDGA